MSGNDLGSETRDEEFEGGGADEASVEASQSDASQAESSEDSELGEALRRIEELERENAQLLDQGQRARAELSNFRRRTIEQRDGEARRITVRVIREVLPLVDDLQMAISASGDSGSSEGQLAEGLRLIVGKFDSILQELGIEPVPAAGEPFDPQWHEAMVQLESSEHEPGTVVAEFVRGYRLGDDLIRPARVSVAIAPADASDNT